MLERWDTGPTWLPTGSSAGGLRRQHYDVVLLDVQMPEMDGLEAAAYRGSVARGHAPAADRDDRPGHAWRPRALSGSRHARSRQQARPAGGTAARARVLRAGGPSATPTARGVPGDRPPRRPRRRSRGGGADPRRGSRRQPSAAPGARRARLRRRPHRPLRARHTGRLDDLERPWRPTTPGGRTSGPRAQVELRQPRSDADVGAGGLAGAIGIGGAARGAAAVATALRQEFGRARPLLEDERHAPFGAGGRVDVGNRR